MGAQPSAGDRAGGLMPTLVETIQRLGASYVIKQGRYDLTADALSLRDQKPIHCGDKYVFTLTLQNDDGSAYDLTGKTIKFTAKYSMSDAEVDAIVQATGVIVTPPGTDGVVTVTILSTAVPGPELIRGYYDLQVATDASDPETFIWGDIEFLPNITQTAP